MRYNFYILIYIYLCKKVFFSRKIFQHKTFFSILKDFFPEIMYIFQRTEAATRDVL